MTDRRPPAATDVATQVTTPVTTGIATPVPPFPEAPMTDATARAAALLAGHRASIDRLDAVLVYTLAERFSHTQAVGRLKADHALPPSDPGREAQQIARLEGLASEAGLDPDFAKKFLGFVIEEVIRHHRRHQPGDTPDTP